MHLFVVSCALRCCRVRMCICVVAMFSWTMSILTFIQSVLTDLMLIEVTDAARVLKLQVVSAHQLTFSPLALALSLHDTGPRANEIWTWVVIFS